MKILVHACCAPCLIAPYEEMVKAGHEIGVYWFNPNIHPLHEYQKRRNTLRDFAETQGFPLYERDEYGLCTFLEATMHDVFHRCEYCYTKRLEAVAKHASQNGYEAFTTTLLYSKYQNHELMVRIATQCAKKHGVEFFYQDFRGLWWDGIRMSKEAGMYRQQYCGCIFSEEDRYREQI